MCYVPDVAAAAKGGYNSAAAALAALGARQSSNEVLMVAPTAFQFNEEAAQDNYFMHSDATSMTEVRCGLWGFRAAGSRTSEGGVGGGGIAASEGKGNLLFCRPFSNRCLMRHCRSNAAGYGP